MSTMTPGLRTTHAAEVPVLADAGALVVEGTLAGCVAAWQLAREGCRTVLAVSACSVPLEIVVARRPWTRPSGWAGLPEPFEEAFAASLEPPVRRGGPILNLAKLGVRCEDLLLDAGVRLFYGLVPCGVELARKGLPSGVVFGGKPGLQLVRAPRILDTTAAATVAALAGAPLRRRALPGGRVTVHFSAKVGEFTQPGPMAILRGQTSAERVETPKVPSLRVRGVPELVGGAIPLHGPWADLRLRLPVDLDDPLWASRLSVAARGALLRVGERANAARLAAGRPALHFHRLPGCLLTDPIVRARASGPGLWVCGPASDVDDREARRLADPFHAARAAPGVARRMLAARLPAARARKLVLSDLPHPRAMAGSAALRFADAPPLHSPDRAVLPKGWVLPVLCEAEVLVAGGGTSGVPAALASARAGARTTLIEQHADLGGVRTVGGVGAYWFGRSTPFQRECDTAYDRVIARAGLAEEGAMLGCLRDAEVEVLAPCAVVGAVREGTRLAGVVVATPRGLGVVRARVFVDATGDADLAAWAGAPFEYGTGRDAMTLWASFGSFNREKRTANRQYESSLEVRDPWDLTRAVVRARRRPGMWSRLEHEMPQHALTPRESRRIVAGATVTYAGILAGETFPDVMVVAESNFDIKGLASSDAGACGAVCSWDVLTRFPAAIPWRAVLPRGVSNLLVAGRAYSASHDALSLARMQRDMVSLGGAVGLSAARAARSGTPPEKLDPRELQAEWVRWGMLRADDLRRFGRHPAPYGAREAARDCRRLLRGEGLASPPLARLMRSRASLGPLRRAFAAARAPARKARLARALAFLGNRQGVPWLLASIERQTRAKLPRLPVQNLAVPPEHGWAPDPVYSLRALERAGAAAAAAPLMAALAGKVADDPARFASKTDSPFEYVHAICAVAERSPGPAMLPPLEALLAKRCLRDLTIPWERDMRFTEDPVLERRAYLEMCLGRALARCADPRGFRILLGYADDVRGSLARSAQTELADLLGRPLPAARRARRLLVERHARSARPRPFRRRID